MRFGILSQYYPPEMGAPQARLSELARRFVARGHQAWVLTAMPNYPSGRIFPGYGGLARRESLDGVTVVRAAIYPTQRVDLRRRMTSYLSFAASALAVGAVTLPRLDFLMTESPPLFLGPTGLALARLTTARWIFNVSDLWPESAVRLGVIGDGWALRAATALEALCYQAAWLVTGQSEETVADIAGRFPDVPTCHLPHGADPELFHPGAATAAARRLLTGGGSERDSAPIAVYTGLHGVAQGLDQILRAADRLGDAGPAIALVGAGPEKAELVALARSLALSRVRFLDPVPRAQMPSLLASGDIALACLKGSLPGAIPSKIYEAMAAGRPLVLVADGESARLVRRAGAGLVVAPGDLDGLAEALRTLTADADLRRRLGEAGRRAAVERFDRRRIFDRFVERLETAA